MSEAAGKSCTECETDAGAEGRSFSEPKARMEMRGHEVKDSQMPIGRRDGTGVLNGRYEGTPRKGAKNEG
jgi:hypothetical protein